MLAESLGSARSGQDSSREVLEKDFGSRKWPGPASSAQVSCHLSCVDPGQKRASRTAKLLNLTKRRTSTPFQRSASSLLRSGLRKLVSLRNKSRRGSSNSDSVQTSIDTSTPYLVCDEESRMDSTVDLMTRHSISEDIFIDGSPDTSTSSILLAKRCDDTLPSLSSMQSAASPDTDMSSDSGLKMLPLVDTREILEQKLVKFAKYGRLVNHANSVDLLVLEEIGQDSAALLLPLCEHQVMQEMYASGLLKRIVDTELLRQALEFFRLWVNLDDLNGATIETSDFTSPIA